MDRSLIQIHQSAIREIAGIFFNRMVQWILGLQFSDTQCGFKAFQRERARIIFEQQRIERFGFDPEILFLAKRQGLRVAEIPVRWSHDAATKVNVAADGLRMFLELIVIRWNSASWTCIPPHAGFEGPAAACQLSKTLQPNHLRSVLPYSIMWSACFFRLDFRLTMVLQTRSGLGCVNRNESVSRNPGL